MALKKERARLVSKLRSAPLKPLDFILIPKTIDNIFIQMKNWIGRKNYNCAI